MAVVTISRTWAYSCGCGWRTARPDQVAVHHGRADGEMCPGNKTPGGRWDTQPNMVFMQSDLYDLLQYDPDEPDGVKKDSGTCPVPDPKYDFTPL